jgi:hypothetical protein
VERKIDDDNRDGGKQITTMGTKRNSSSNMTINQEFIWDSQARRASMKQQHTAGNSYDNKQMREQQSKCDRKPMQTNAYLK